MNSLPPELIELVCCQLTPRQRLHLAMACAHFQTWSHVYAVVVLLPLTVCCSPVALKRELSFDELSRFFEHFSQVHVDVNLRQCCRGRECIFGHMVTSEAEEISLLLHQYQSRILGISCDFIHEFTLWSSPNLIKNARFYDAPLDHLQHLQHSLLSLELVGYSHAFFNLASLTKLQRLRVHSPSAEYYDATCTLVLPTQLECLELDRAKAAVWTGKLPHLKKVRMFKLEVRWDPDQLTELESIVCIEPAADSLDAVLAKAPNLKSLEVVGLKQLSYIPPSTTRLIVRDVPERVIEVVEFPPCLTELELDVDTRLVLDLAVLGPQLRRVDIVQGGYVNIPHGVTQLTLNHAISMDPFTGLERLQLVGDHHQGSVDFSFIPHLKRVEVVKTQLTSITGWSEGLESFEVRDNDALLRMASLQHCLALRDVVITANATLTRVAVDAPHVLTAKISDIDRVELPCSLVSVDIDWETVTYLTSLAPYDQPTPTPSLPPLIAHLRITLKALLHYTNLPLDLKHLEIIGNLGDITIPQLPRGLKRLRVGAIDTHIPAHFNNLVRGRLVNDLSTLFAHSDDLQLVEIIGVELACKLAVHLPATVQVVNLNLCCVDELQLKHNHTLRRLLLVGTHRHDGKFVDWTWSSVGSVKYIDALALPKECLPPSKFPGVPLRHDPWWNPDWWHSVMSNAPTEVREVRHEQFWYEPGRGTVQAYCAWTRDGPLALCLLWNHELEPHSK